VLLELGMCSKSMKLAHAPTRAHGAKCNKKEIFSKLSNLEIQTEDLTVLTDLDQSDYQTELNINAAKVFCQLSICLRLMGRYIFPWLLPRRNQSIKNILWAQQFQWQ
jgi:hypothetical protein